MQLRYISIPLLIGEAGGDPWAVNKSLQVGQPVQISGLAEAFHAAGRCTVEAQTAFEQARSRFGAAWNRENGDHPINDAAEVQRVTKSVGAQSVQLPKIGVDLENIAAALAEAQRGAAGQIATLEGQLQKLDDIVGGAVEAEKDPTLSTGDRAALSAIIDGCDHDAIDDTVAALGELRSIRARYSDCLQNSLKNLQTEGYDAAVLHGLDSDAVPQPSLLQAGQMADIRRVLNQAVLDEMAKVRAAQDALNKALAEIYTHGPGSPEGEAAAASVPKLKADLAHALDDLGKIPDYSNIDPASVATTPDGHFVFSYNVDGQTVQVVGQLKDGSGEFFDQGTSTNYSFKDGKLSGMRTLDPGKVQATPEPLWSATTLAVGGYGLKAAGTAAWQGLKTLFTRETLEGLTSDNVLPRALSAAQIRAAIAEESLPPRSPLPDISGQPIPGTEPVPPPVVEHTPSAGPGGDVPVDHGPGGPHAPALPDSPPVPREPPPPLPADHPLFHGYQPVEPGPEFTHADGSLIYPDDTLPSKPYAMPGTIVPDANLPAGAILTRFGYPGGSYLAPEGTPFAELALPPGSAVKPYYEYFVKDPTALPPGYHIEQSQAAPWFHQPGGGTQYRIIGPDGRDAPVDALLDSQYLGDVHN
jgi:hypothetical protein